MSKPTTRFDVPFFVKNLWEDDSVIVAGKSPELMLTDLRDGIARFGGPWREPSYMHAYIKAADLLVNQALHIRNLDDLGLPIFYLQRHAMELLLKRLLHWFVELAELKRRNTGKQEVHPTNGEIRRFKTSHDLLELWEDLVNLSLHFGHERLPDEIKLFIDLAVPFEKSNTWSRYAASRSKTTSIRHIDSEIQLPVVRLQRSLVDAVSFAISKNGFDNAYECELYKEWCLYQY